LECSPALRLIVLTPLVLVAISCQLSSESPGLYGKTEAPEMNLVFLDGTVSRLADLEGKVVLLNFWATWCSPCRQELPHFEVLHQTYKDQGLAVIGVSMDQAGTDYVLKFTQDAGLSYPIAVGSFEEMEKIWSKVETIPTVHGFGDEPSALSNGSVQMMPTTFMIDRMGKIYRKHVGPRDRKTLEPDLRVLMGIAEPLASSS
jgi:thiol-disulfide isomerase/thioredoxin